MGAHPDDTPQGPAGGRLGSDLAAHVEAIVRAAEREAHAAERAIADRRRSAEEEVRRYLAAARLHADAEAAARAARIETLSTSTRRLADELDDAVTALRSELQRDEADLAGRIPRAPWPSSPPPASEPPAASTPPTAASVPASAPEPTWTRNVPPTPSPEAEPAAAAAQPATETAAPLPTPAANGAFTDDAEPPVPSAARLVAIEMAVGGSSRAEVEEHLRTDLDVAEPQPLLDDVFGAASHAGSRLAWGEP